MRSIGRIGRTIHFSKQSCGNTANSRGTSRCLSQKHAASAVLTSRLDWNFSHGFLGVAEAPTVTTRHYRSEIFARGHERAVLATKDSQTIRPATHTASCSHAGVLVGCVHAGAEKEGLCGGAGGEAPASSRERTAARFGGLFAF